eukprot:s3505_g7.t1
MQSISWSPQQAYRNISSLDPASMRLFFSSSCAYLPSRHRRDVAMGASACTCADSKCRCEEDHPEGVAELGPLDDFDLSQMPTCAEAASSMIVIPISDVTQELALQDKAESWPHAFVLKPANLTEPRRPQPGGTPRTNSSELSSTKEYVIDVVRPFSGETDRSSINTDARMDSDNQGPVGSVASPADAKSNEEGAKDSPEQIVSSAPEMQTLHHISDYLSESDEDDTVKRSSSFSQKTLPDKLGPTTTGLQAGETYHTTRRKYQGRDRELSAVHRECNLRHVHHDGSAYSQSPSNDPFAGLQSIAASSEAEPPAGSPVKRNRSREEHPSPGAATIAMRELLRQNNAELKMEITQAVGQRVELVEKTVTSQLMDTQKMLKNITATQDEHGGAIKELQQDHRSLATRLGALELRSASGTGSSWASTAAEETDKRRPAMVMGGWNEDEHGEATLAASKQMVADLRIDLDVDQAFCPGVRRGFVIICGRYTTNAKFTR